VQKETRLKIKVQARLRGYNPKVWYTKLQQKTKRGDPDLLLCANGILIAWELKTEKGKLSSLQKYTIGEIATAGGIARVVTPDNLDLAFEELEWILKNTNIKRKPGLPSPEIILPA
jgi:hypothetical protein